MSDDHLIGLCEALHPGEQIEAAGAFQPRGTQGMQMLGPAGALMGWMLAKNAHLPRYSIVAVTPDNVLFFKAETLSLGWKPAELIGTYPRTSTGVLSQQGVQVRKLTLTPSGATPIALESPRMGRWHGAGVISALRSTATA